MKENDCPICSHACQFEQMYHHMLYLIGSLTIENIEKDSPIDEFYKSTISNCRTFMLSKKTNKANSIK